MITVDKKLTDHRQELVTQTGQTNTQLLSLIMNNIPQAVFWKDRDLVFLGCNQAFVEDAGLTSPEDIIGKTDFDLTWKEHAELYRADDLRVMESGEPKINYEEPHTTSDGLRTWVRTSKIPVRENGEIVAVLGMYEDITERKNAEKALTDSEAQFRLLFEQSADAVLLIENGIFIDCNDATVRMMRATNKEEFLSLHPSKLSPEYQPDGRHSGEKADEMMRIALERGSNRFEWIHRRVDGTDFPVEVLLTPISRGDHQFIHTVWRDITERKQLEEGLLLRDRALASSINAVMINALDGKAIYVNEAFLKLFGYSHEEALQLSPLDIAPLSEDVEEGLSAIRSQGFFVSEKLAKRKDGSIFPINLSASLITNAEGQPIATQATFIDITERKRIEESLRQSETDLLAALQVANMGLWEFDLATGLFTFNDQYYSLHGTTAQEVGGYQMSVQRFAQEFAYPEDAYLVGQATQQAIETTDPNFHVQIETRIMRVDGEPRWVTIWFRVEKDAQGRTIKLHGVSQDITEGKKLEQQIQLAFERRGVQVQLSTQVSQAIASAATLEELYERVVIRVKEHFNYYHTQLLRYDPAQEAVVLVTGYGEAGRKMLATGHRLLMGEGLIGAAVATGETVLRPALENDLDWRPNPLLPDTKGEIAVPIKLGNTILGVLDVQSSEADALGKDDQLLLEGLCGQIATAIESTRLRQEMAERLEEINRLYRAMSHEGWQSYRETSGVAASFMFDQVGLRPVDDSKLVDESFAKMPLIVPGGEIIGALAIADDPQRPVSAEDQAFLEQVAEQVALALESARLFEQTQEALIQAEELSRQNELILDTAGEGIFGLDENGNHTFVNPAAAAMLGYSIDELIGAQSHSIWHHSHPDGSHYPSEECPIYASLHEGKIYQGEEYFWRKDGNGFVVDFTSTPVKQSDRTIGAVVTFRDITERKKAEEVVRLAQQRAQMILESVTLPMVITRLSDNHLTFVNQPALEVTQFRYADVIDQPSPDFYYNLDDRKKFIAELRAKGKVSDMVVQLRRQNGEPFWALLSATLFDYENQASILSTFMDITDRIRAQESIAKRATELATVAQVSTTASTVLDPDKLLQAVVDLTKERFGLYHAHIYLADESWSTLLLAAGAGEVGRKLVAEEHAIPMSIEQSLVTRAVRERKAIIVNDVNSEPGFLPNPLLPETCAEMAVPMIVGDKVLGVFDVQSNSAAGFSEEDANIYITLASQVGVALQNARLYIGQAATLTQLRELDKLKSSFLANMSHELRTPLNSILGFTDVIMEGLDGPLTDNMDSDLRLIQKNGQHLLHLINDVLDMAKIEAGRMNLQPETFKVHSLLEEVSSITSTLASEKNLALFIDESSDQEIEVYADDTRLRQVMINLVNNAIKFTENGKILLSAKPLEGARVLIIVKDTGIGIPPEKLEAIFQEFTQVDSSPTRKTGGTGLGLPISRRLVEMHGGRLWAESTGISGEGSTFFVELPLEARITEVVEKQVK